MWPNLSFQLQNDLSILKDLLPDKYNLNQNYPNPFSQQTKLFLVLNKDAKIDIEIFDQKGSRVKVLLSQNLKKGRYELNLCLKNLSNGIFTAVWMSDNKLVKTIKMIKQTN